jgi:CelD/BcsL family acetyltransferase involved in cellulose biosynthesis
VHAFEAISANKLWMRWSSPASAAANAEAPVLDFSISRDFDFMSAEYANLFENSDATPFQHPVWLARMFARLVAASGRSPQVLLGRTRSDRRLVVVFPLIRRKFAGFSLLEAADLDVGDYNAIVVDRTLAKHPAVAPQILRALDRRRRVRVRRVRNGVIGISGDKLTRTTVMDFKSHEVELPASADDWQASVLKPDFARFLAKKRKRLRAKGQMTFGEVSEPERIREAFEAMRRLRGNRWSNDLLLVAEYFEFYVDVAIAGQASGLSRTYVLSVDDVPVSVMFGVWHRKHFCFLLLGFDHVKFRNYSTGLLALESGIEDSIRRGDTIFDLTIGDEEYKRNFATRSVPLATWWFGRRPWIALAPYALSVANRGRAMVRRMREARAKREAE